MQHYFVTLALGLWRNPGQGKKEIDWERSLNTLGEWKENSPKTSRMNFRLKLLISNLIHDHKNPKKQCLNDLQRKHAT